MASIEVPALSSFEHSDDKREHRFEYEYANEYITVGKDIFWGLYTQWQKVHYCYCCIKDWGKDYEYSNRAHIWNLIHSPTPEMQERTRYFADELNQMNGTLP